jgi:hypothetical protein
VIYDYSGSFSCLPTIFGGQIGERSLVVILAFIEEMDTITAIHLFMMDE